MPESTQNILDGAGEWILLAALVVATVAFLRERWRTLILALVIGSILYTVSQDPVGTVAEAVRWFWRWVLVGEE